MRRCGLRRAGVHDFVDPHYLKNKRPAIPGGAWSRDLLRRKSVADLQQLWFLLLRERAMLRSTKQHYLEHTEDLGAMPAPSRLTMVEESMGNIKAVMRERDNEATDRAVAIFNERLAQGVYRYPPGPPMPPGHGDTSSTVRLVFDRYVEEEAVPEVFGRYDVFEAHKGIAKVEVAIAPEALQQKVAAEEAFEAWRMATDDVQQYARYNAPGGQAESYFDSVPVELAPGKFAEEPVVAATLPVNPLPPAPPPKDVLSRLKWEDSKWHERRTLQYNQYPHAATEAPADPGPRPTHPDEIEGPWVVTIQYADKGGYEYAQSLEVQRVHGATVVSIEDATVATPVSERCPVFQEALREAAADKEHLKTWPNVPVWKKEYSEWLRRPLEEIIVHNYSNVGDYVDREALLTGKSIWEKPIEVDASCGNQVNVPPHAKPYEHDFINPDYLRGGDH